MPTTTYNDLAILHRYLEEITTFIQAIVKRESAALVIACQVFEAHNKKTRKTPFESEQKRLLWLQLRSRTLANQYVERKKREEIQEKAFKMAIHDYPAIIK